MGEIFIDSIRETAEMVSELIRQGLNIEVHPGEGKYQFVIKIKGH